jgi:hypothetical protein
MSAAPTPSRKSLYARLTASVPLLVTVIVHVVLVAVAGYFVVSEQILGKKKSFEATNAAEPSVAQKQVEHRLQVARKGGGSASASPVSASRIFSTDSNALQLSAPPELNMTGASALAGMGFGSGAGGMGTGTGFGTGIGSGSALGTGFMSMSFLGTTNQRSSKVVFVIEVGPKLLDIRKGGFEAFAIIREEIMKLVSRLSPSTEFGVVLYDTNDNGMSGAISPFDLKLLPATTANKTRFFEWLKPINTNAEKLGLRGVKTLAWTAKPVPSAGLDPDLRVETWLRALRCGLEMEPDTVFVITTSAGYGQVMVSDAELAKRKRQYDQAVAELKRSGVDTGAAQAARDASDRKALAQLSEINAKLKAQGKSPFIVQHPNRIFEADFQAALKRAGFTITRDTTGWVSKEGKQQYVNSYYDFDTAEYPAILTYVSQLQRALLKERASLNLFLFVGPAEDPKDGMEKLGKMGSRNGGKVQLLTTKRLKEMSAKEDAAK